MPTDTSTGVSAPASEDYWRKIAYKERTRADDNLRLAAERANAIQELVEDLGEATKTIQELSKELGAEKTEIERLKGIIERVEQSKGYCPCCHEPIVIIVKAARSRCGKAVSDGK